MYTPYRKGIFWIRKDYTIYFQIVKRSQPFFIGLFKKTLGSGGGANFSRPLECVFCDDDGDDLVDDGRRDDRPRNDGREGRIYSSQSFYGNSRKYQRYARVGQTREPQVFRDGFFRFRNFTAHIGAADFSARPRQDIDERKYSRARDQTVIQRQTEIDDHDDQREI